MSVGLVTYIPYQLIIGGFKNVVQRHRQLNNAQTCAKMATINRNIIDNKLAKFVAKLHQLSLIQLFDVFRAVDFRQ